MSKHQPNTALAGTDLFLRDVLAGLTAARKTLPCKYFYDERGSALFDQICDLPEYYPTRTELGIMRTYIAQIAEAIGHNALIIELGSGSSVKTEVLLEHLREPAGCVLVDISGDHLTRSADGLARGFPDVEIVAVPADFTRPFTVPHVARPVRRRVVYFPGSTVGNFTHEETEAFLARTAEMCGPGGGLLIGVDLQKPADVLERAYDDADGVTAAFNLNLLARINRELGANIDVKAFSHRAIYDAESGRVEMLLVSTRDQVATIGGVNVHFSEGEPISTEYSHKYTLEGFAALAKAGGFAVTRVWTDPAELFSVQYLRVAEP